MSSQGGSRHDRRKQETRDRIREAAIGLFAEQGYEATKVAEICEGADVARQTFFNHYPTKSAVLEETLAVGLDFTEAQVLSACERGASTRERLALFFRDTVASAVSVGPASRDLVAHILKINEDAVAVRQRARISGFFLEIVERGLELGDVTRRHPPEVLAALCEGALVSLIGAWRAGDDFDTEERAARLAELAADAITLRPDED